MKLSLGTEKTETWKIESFFFLLKNDVLHLSVFCSHAAIYLIKELWINYFSNIFANTWIKPYVMDTNLLLFVCLPVQEIRQQLVCVVSRPGQTSGEIWRLRFPRRCSRPESLQEKYLSRRKFQVGQIQEHRPLFYHQY